MSWNRPVKDEVLTKCGRHCCICHTFCGLKIEIHHIKPPPEGGDNTVENAIPLCFNCHADMKSYDHKHPKGTKYSEQELRNHRERWYGLVSNNWGSGNQDRMEQDIDTFSFILTKIPIKGSIYYLRGIVNSTGFYGGISIENDRLDQLTSIYFDFQLNPWLEFFDSDLESMRSQLLFNIGNFIHYYSKNTFPVKGQTKLQEIPPEWKDNQQDRLEQVENELNKLGDEVCAAYDTLLKTARSKLGINIQLQ